MATRTLHHADALTWLAENASQAPIAGASFMTSLPDVSGVLDMDFPSWRAWFIDAAEAVMRATPDDGVSIFYQSDIKLEGRWIDKSYLCHQAAERAGSELLWHKVVCRNAAGTVTHGRPNYAHLLCYSRGLRDDPAHATMDVLPEAGAVTWSRATGVAACRLACRYIQRRTATRTVVDPFCGVGTVLAVANQLGLDAIGVDRSRRRLTRARKLEIDTVSGPGARRAEAEAEAGAEGERGD